MALSIPLPLPPPLCPMILFYSNSHWNSFRVIPKNIISWEYSQWKEISFPQNITKSSLSFTPHHYQYQYQKQQQQSQHRQFCSFPSARPFHSPLSLTFHRQFSSSHSHYHHGSGQGQGHGKIQIPIPDHTNGSLSPPPSSFSPSPSPPPPLSSPSFSSSPSPLPGWYQRPLPSHLIPFSSPLGKEMFQEALLSGGMEGYFPLSEQFSTQSEPSYCGPTTLMMVLNSLQIDPKKIWKGNWRWISEEMLENCDVRKPNGSPLQHVDTVGLSFEEFFFMAECNGASVQPFIASNSTEEKFRSAVFSSTRTPNLHTIVSFSRKLLGQTGCGHFSPIGGYHVKKDFCLILDVARFKYPPYWVHLPMLWKAIGEVDNTTKKGRGYYLMSKNEQWRGGEDKGKERERDSSPFPPDVFHPLNSSCHLSISKSLWNHLAETFCVSLPNRLKQMEFNGKITEPHEAFQYVLQFIPIDFHHIFTLYSHQLHKRYNYKEKEKDKKNGNSHWDSAKQSTHHDDHHDPRENSPSPFPMYSQCLPSSSPHHHPHTKPTKLSLQSLLNEIVNTPMYALVKHKALSAPSLTTTIDKKYESGNSFSLLGGQIDGDLDKELITILLLATPHTTYSKLSTPLQQKIYKLNSLSLSLQSNKIPSELRKEIQHLRAQMGILTEFCDCQGQKGEWTGE